MVRKEIKPLGEENITAFLNGIKGHRHQVLYTIALFTIASNGLFVKSFFYWPQIRLNTKNYYLGYLQGKVKSLILQCQSKVLFSLLFHYLYYTPNYTRNQVFFIFFLFFLYFFICAYYIDFA